MKIKLAHLRTYPPSLCAPLALVEDSNMICISKKRRFCFQGTKIMIVISNKDISVWGGGKAFSWRSAFFGLSKMQVSKSLGLVIPGYRYCFTQSRLFLCGFQFDRETEYE